MKRRTPPRAEKTAFAASPDVGENTDSDAKTPRGLNQNRRHSGRERHVAPRPERRGRSSARKAPACGRAAVFRRSEEARRAGTPARRRRPAPPESSPPRGKERLRVLSAGMPPAAGDRAASGRASGIFRPPCSLARTARGSRRARRAGQADEPRFCTVAQRLRGQKACPQAEHGSKKGKEQQKGLSSPGQSRKRKALFMFMGKR